MCKVLEVQLTENNTFVQKSGSTSPQVNEEFLKETVIKTVIVRCIKCGEIAYGYDEFDIAWCYEPNAHPNDIFPMHKKIKYNLA